MPVSPPGTRPPVGATISAIDTVMREVSTVDDANTLRATCEYGGTVTSSSGSGANCRNDADPPTGWLVIVSRKLRTRAVAFSATTTNARGKSPSGLLLPGADTNSPSVTRAV